MTAGGAVGPVYAGRWLLLGMQKHTNATTDKTKPPTVEAKMITNSCELSSPLDGGGGGGVCGGEGGGGGDGGAVGDAATTAEVSSSTGTPSVAAALDASGKAVATLALSACASASLPETVERVMSTTVDPAESLISIAFTEIATASANF